MPCPRQERPLRGIGVVVCATCPIAPTIVWVLDFQFHETSDGGSGSFDQYRRECIAIVVKRFVGAGS